MLHTKTVHPMAASQYGPPVSPRCSPLLTPAVVSHPQGGAGEGLGLQVVENKQRRWLEVS
jgi:hypothetical protein